ncbi:glycosyltransferase family 2 protein [Stieleria sp. TO1_6]|uniref:glycosyltransferase family 2 protein n=1 Tax=Stieleria tagensis TaxID=2956795 RepID=UPI00209B708E|nr:glycosyltransferase family 2 protein [Stieleria tagensis]MCO8123585.1 glycosyltransferase family 2 protein [Stieleria tagensis]
MSAHSQPSIDPPSHRNDLLETSDAVVARAHQSLRGIELVLAQLQGQPMDQYELTVIVPVLNERTTLPKILDRIDQVMPPHTETIVVDDASTDGTAEWLASLPPRLNRRIIRRGRNHGKGSAVRLGIRHSHGAIVAIQDADLEYDPIDLLQVIAPIQTGQAEVVYGSRYLQDQADPSAFHRLGNWALTAISNCMTGQHLTDMETCHKAFRGDLVRSIKIRECRFGFEPEITGKVAARGVAIVEVPTGYDYRSYDEGKKITWKDGVAALGCMWRYRTRHWSRRMITGITSTMLRLPMMGIRRVTSR